CARPGIGPADWRDDMSTGTTAAPTRRPPELLGQTVVVIGGSAGIGLETGDVAQRQRGLSGHPVMPIQVARNARSKVRPGGTLLPALIASLALELAPIRVNLSR